MLSLLTPCGLIIQFANKNASILIKKHKNDLALHTNAFQINKKIIYGVRNRIEIGEERYYSYLYLDEKRRVEEREQLLSRVLEIEKKVEEPELSKNREELKELHYLERSELTLGIPLNILTQIMIRRKRRKTGPMTRRKR